MIVAIDATPLSVSSGGLRRYTEELTCALRDSFPDDQYHLLSDQTEAVSGLDRKWWSIGVQRAMRRLRCDVFHGTDFAVPYLPLRPSVLSLHDLSPWMNPEWHHGADRVRRRTPLLIRLGIATLILTQTEAVRQEAIQHFRVSPMRVIAIPLAASSRFRHVQGQPAEGRPYFLYVGTIEPRKNVPALVHAWQSLRARHDVDLVLAGRLRKDGPALPAVDGLRVLGEVSEDRLPLLYSNCVACVYPTEYEGFGLPVLEAMQCGAPVITSLDPAVREVSGGAAIHVTSDRLAEAMEGLLTNSHERERRSELGRNRATEFSWARTAAATREVYVEAIRRFHA